jgi:hypothetical protein
MNNLNYTKDPKTGAVIFNDTDGYQARKKVIAKNKMRILEAQSNKKVINSMRNDIKNLTSLIESLR